MAASGDLAGAVQLASQSLGAPHHDHLAAFLCDLDGVKGATAALGLLGLTLVAETRLRLQVCERPALLFHKH